jgi:hypothetical protein
MPLCRAPSPTAAWTTSGGDELAPRGSPRASASAAKARANGAHAQGAELPFLAKTVQISLSCLSKLETALNSCLQATNGRCMDRRPATAFSQAPRGCLRTPECAAGERRIKRGKDAATFRTACGTCNSSAPLRRPRTSIRADPPPPGVRAGVLRQPLRQPGGRPAGSLRRRSRTRSRDASGSRAPGLDLRPSPRAGLRP